MGRVPASCSEFRFPSVTRGRFSRLDHTLAQAVRGPSTLLFPTVGKGLKVQYPNERGHVLLNTAASWDPLIPNVISVNGFVLTVELYGCWLQTWEFQVHWIC